MMIKQELEPSCSSQSERNSERRRRPSDNSLLENSITLLEEKIAREKRVAQMQT